VENAKGFDATRLEELSQATDLPLARLAQGSVGVDVLLNRVTVLNYIQFHIAYPHSVLMDLRCGCLPSPANEEVGIELLFRGALCRLIFVDCWRPDPNIPKRNHGGGSHAGVEQIEEYLEQLESIHGRTPRRSWRRSDKSRHICPFG